MSDFNQKIRPFNRREVLVGVTASVALMPTVAFAAETVRIALVASWWPNAIAVAAERLNLFPKEGLKAELTFYKGGGPSFEALAAGAADFNINGGYMVALGRSKGVKAKIVATGSTSYAGWHLVVPKDSPIKSVSELASKKVGISANGSISDFLALWTNKNKGVNYLRVPLGAGGILPSLAAGNVDAAVLWSPQSLKALQDGTVRSLLDFGSAVAPDLNAGWIATEEILATRPKAVQGTLNALFGAVQHLRQNRQFAVDLIAELNSISKDIAAKEYEGNILAASTDGVISPQAVERSIELGKAAGLAITVPAADTFVTRYKPVPTRA